MVMNFIRSNKIIAGLLTILRIFIGYKFITMGYMKISGGGFNAGGFIQYATETPSVPGWWALFLKTVALPNAELFSFMVMWGELFVGIALVLGIFTNFAALMGITMNLSFLFSGSGMIDAQMAAITVFLVISGHNAGRFGLDRWVLPHIKSKINKKIIKKQKTEDIVVA